MNPINAISKSELRHRIEERLTELRTRLFELQNEMYASTSTKHVDRLDLSQEVAQRDAILREKDNLERQIRRHSRALKRWHEFGICEECDGEIPEARLRFDPTISTCVDCQSLLDSRSA